MPAQRIATLLLLGQPLHRSSSCDCSGGSRSTAPAGLLDVHCTTPLGLLLTGRRPSCSFPVPVCISPRCTTLYLSVPLCTSPLCTFLYLQASCGTLRATL